MNEIVTLQDVINFNSSDMPRAASALREGLDPTFSHGQLAAAASTANYPWHYAMVRQSASGAEAVHPVWYVRLHRPFGVPESSSSNSRSTLREGYSKVESQLGDLANVEDDVRTIEKGAVQSALYIVEQLKQYQLTPPELSWHGGDAIVMLWSLYDTTFAITVTDGEFGYVVRRNRKAIKMADSISVDRFRLLGLS